MTKTLFAVALITLCTSSCSKRYSNNARPITFAIHEVVNCAEPRAVLVSNPRSTEKYCVAREAIVTEKDIRGATVVYSWATKQPQLCLYFDHAGATRMYVASERISMQGANRSNQGQMAILIEGQLLTAPIVRGTIRDSLVLDGVSEAMAQNLADGLMAGK